MDKLASLRVFASIVEQGGFAAAGRQLHLSRSAVSKHLRELERELGVQLLRRTTRSASPTESGRDYYERSRAILAELDEADRMVSLHQAEPRGLLRVNAPMSFGTLHLGRAVADFMARYPALKVQLLLSDQLIDPVQEGYDVTLRIAELAGSSMIARRIVETKRVICASPAYFERRGHPCHPDELKHHDCLAYGYLATGNQWKLTGPDGDHWIEIPWVICSNNAEILRDAALAGRGVALLPTFIAGAALQTGALVSVLADYRAPALALHALYPQTRHLSAKIRLFIDFLVERFADRPYWDLVE
jgi:DNA-binding transcriptional LysR family regulator